MNLYIYIDYRNRDLSSWELPKKIGLKYKILFFPHLNLNIQLNNFLIRS